MCCYIDEVCSGNGNYGEIYNCCFEDSTLSSAHIVLITIKEINGATTIFLPINMRLSYLVDWIEDYLRGDRESGDREDQPPRCILLLAGDTGYEVLHYQLRKLGIQILIMFSRRSTHRKLLWQAHFCDAFVYLFPINV